MRPALLLVCDPTPGAAAETFADMLAAWGDPPRESAAAAAADIWAALGLPPAAVNEPACGADILQTESDLLIWAGEMFIPPSWLEGIAETGRLARISAAVLHRLRTRGLEALADIDGGFCGAWLERRSRRWFIFNDKLGQIPIFWSADGQRLVVSPQAWLTWQGSRAPLRVSEQGVADLIRTQNMCEDHTLIENVHWLPRGQALCWGDEGAGYCRYWDFDYAREPLEAPQQALDLYLERMEVSMRRHTAAQAPLLLGISGGLDSRIYLALCERIGRLPRCFTSGWRFYEDVRFGRKVARAAGAAHEIAELRAEGLPDRLEMAIIASDGLQSAAHLPPATASLAYLGKHTGSVLLEGFYHGLIGGGAVPADEDVAPGIVPHRSRWAAAALHSGGSVESINDLFEPRLARESYERWCARIDSACRAARFADPLSRAEYAVVHARLGRAEMTGTALLRSQVLVRNPAADAAMLDWHQRVSPRLRRGRALYLELLRRDFPRYARVPRADGCGALPISRERWRRELCWQADRIHRWYAAARYPLTRRWGRASSALRAWAFEVWRVSGRLHVLLEPDARVLNWVRREPLLDAWKAAAQSPVHAQQVLTLATIEVMVRWLEARSGQRVTAAPLRHWIRARVAKSRIPHASATAGGAA